jgi:hypothetical protein
MDQCSFRVYSLNILTLIISFTDLEAILKIILLLISIIYTSMKIYDWAIIKIKGTNANNNKETLQD